MYLKKAHVMIVLVWKLMFCEGDAEKACSCYTFESDQNMTWQNAMSSCKYNKKHLLAMETEREWQFINNELKNRTTTNGSNKDEWHIGLFWNTTVKNWTWVNGKPLTITKWQPSEPGNTLYVLIAKEWPKGKYGTFNGIRGDIQRAWICEDETDDCQGVCMHHNPAATTITTPRSTTSTIETTRSNTLNHTDVSESMTLARTSNLEERKHAKNNSTLPVIIGACLGVVLFVALIILAAFIILRRRRQHRSEDSGYDTPKKNALPQPESSYESIDPAEAAKLLRGTPKNGKDGLQKIEQTEYAMANKKVNRKQKKGDLVYAQLDMPEFEDTGNDTKVRKPVPYAPTVYADVVPTKVINEADPNTNLPPYENVQKTTKCK